MKITATLFTCALTCLAGAAQAQSTNYSNTSAERNAAMEARTAAAATKAARGTGSSSSSSSTSSSSSPSNYGTSGGSYNPFEAQMLGERQAAKERAAANARRQAYLRAEQEAKEAKAAEEQRQWDSGAAERAAQFRALQTQKEKLAAPYQALGFTSPEAQVISKWLADSRSSPELLAALLQMRQAKQAYDSLFLRPDAAYEQLRALMNPPHIITQNRLGLTTAARQYRQLWQRFPAHRATAAADFAWAASQYFTQPFDAGYVHEGILAQERPIRLELLATMKTITAENPALAWPAWASMAAGIMRVPAQLNPVLISDSTVLGPVLRLGYAGTRQSLRPGQRPPLGLSEAQLRTTACLTAQRLGYLAQLQNHPDLVLEWSMRAVEARAPNPPVAQLLSLISEQPGPALTTHPPDWQRLSAALELQGQLPAEALTKWLADTVAYFDHPRWQQLTPPQRLELDLARMALLYLLPQGLTWGNGYAREKLVPNQFPIGRRQLREKLATWTMVLFPAGSSEAADALTLWKQAAQLGSLAGARNAYRAYLLRDRAPKVESDMVLRPLNLFCNFKSSESNLRYLGALVLLDELPGYPPLGKVNKKEGRAWLEAAKAAGSTAAAARLAR